MIFVIFFCFSLISSQRLHGAFCTRSSGTWEKLTDEWRPPLSSMLFSSQWSRVLCWRFGGGGLGGSFGETVRSCSFGINVSVCLGLLSQLKRHWLFFSWAIPRSYRFSTENGRKSFLLRNVNCIIGNWLRLKRLIPMRKVRHRKLPRPHAPGNEARARGGNYILGSFLITV